MSTAFAPRSSMAASTGPGTMPTTPRGGYSATGTPRSARRLLGANTPSSRASFAPSSSFASGLPPSGGAAPVLAPLPPINARAYPDRPYADDDELRSVMDADRDAVDTACALLGAALAQQRKAVLEALEEIGAEKRRLDKMTRELGDAAREMVRTVQREKDELDRARELEGEVTARGRALAVQVETAQAEVKEVLAKLAARRELKAKQRAAFATHVSRNGPELAFFEHKLGLKIRGRARDVVQFKFQHIDPASHARTFSFDLDASQPTYSLSSPVPASLLPPSLSAPLVAQLNTSRDLYAFVRAVRSAVVNEVRVEKKLGVGGGEAERERERRRMREREGRERELEAED
ncbi:kinetochore protein spc25 [Rhodotorula diobovata]|uniref:Kinetochore protein SPC25 n=1 Tax=Rhodotorula diobovata TaxID=5288 RepID=A0A5C5G4E4_9BASI|nr:kinetochore protein spc25 [Rhodotorula diobovata]